MSNPDSVNRAELAQRLIAEQNFAAALVAGFVAMVIAAVGYGIVVVTWPFAYGFAAASIGVVIGFFMGFLGRGLTARFSVAAAAFTVAGCLLGSLAARLLNTVMTTGISLLDVVMSRSLADLVGLAFAGFALVHLVYWFVAVVAAVFLAKRPLSRVERFALQSR